MNKRFWVSLLLVAAVALMSNGCKKKTQATGPFSPDDGGRIGIIGSEDIFAEDIAGWRPGEGNMLTAADGQNPFEPVFFGYDSSQIGSSERVKVESVADYLRKNATVGVIIEGHTDERGSREYNMALGERRALAVRAYLIGLGIDGQRIQTKSYGEENPVAFGHDESAWSLNRRGEFILFY